MFARDLVKSNRAAITINGDSSIYDAMASMTQNKIGSLIVLDNDKRPMGIITESDIFQLAFVFGGEMMQLSIKDNMSTGLIMAMADDDIEFIAEVMTNNDIQHVPIMDEDGALCGIISARDVIRVNLQQMREQKEII